MQFIEMCMILNSLFITGIIIVNAYEELRLSTLDQGNYVDAENVPNVYDHYTKLSTYGLYNVTGTFILLEVKSCRDAAILLSVANDLVSPDFYEIMLGGSSNSYIYLTRNYGSNDASFSAPSLLNCNNMVTLWISWESGRLQVGKGLNRGQNIVMDWMDPNSALNIYGIGLMSSWGSNAEWIIHMENIHADRFCGTNGYKVTNPSINLFISSAVNCAVLCRQITGCLTFNYNSLSEICNTVNGGTFLLQENNLNWKLFATCWTI